MHLIGAKIKGFKSFADQFDLSFGPGLTAVIGPNGSGKSNLAEAVRWVLGEQSLKQLRGRSSTDIIFAGSSRRKAGRLAVVELLLSNESGRFPVEAAEVSVGRRLTSGGESEYTINGDTVRLLDVHRMLAEAGIGTKTYTVISQGTVDQYVTATPAGRRELFEEATGVKALQLQLKESERKLERSLATMHELGLIEQELQPRLVVLEREAKRVAEKETVVEQFAKAQLSWFRFRWHQLNGESEHIQMQLQDWRVWAGEVRAKRETIEQTLFSALQNRGQSAQADVWLRLRQAEDDLAAAKGAWQKTKDQCEHLQRDIAVTGAALTKAQEELSRRREESAQFDWLKTMRRLLHEARDVLTALKGGQVPAEEMLGKLLGHINRMLEESDESTPMQSAKALLHYMEGAVRETTRLETLVTEYKRQLAALPDVAQPSDQEVVALRGQVAAVQATPAAVTVPDTVQKELAECRQQELEAEREVSGLEAALQQAQGQLQVVANDILRELGTQQLETIQHFSLSTAEHAPSEREVRRLAVKVEALSAVNPIVVQEFAEVQQRYDEVTRQLQDANHTVSNIQQLMGNLQGQIAVRFDQQFAVIAQHFSNSFVRLFGGGEARLEQVPEGIEVTVKLPGKKARHIQLLSGGEKALTSLALLFAVIHAQQPPFLVLDEVDAALDEANADRFARLLKEESRLTQCIVITHNRATMGQADVLYGVTMSEPGVSSIYSVKLSEVAAEVAQEVQV